MAELESSAAVAEYQAAVRAVVVAARMLEPYDIAEMLRQIEHADAFGPIIDPTLWRYRRGAMLEDREILEAALPLKALAKKLREHRSEETSGAPAGR